MFQFPSLPLTLNELVPSFDQRRVSPFGHPELLRVHTPRSGFSQCAASFLGIWCLGIPYAPFFAFVSCDTEIPMPLCSFSRVVIRYPFVNLPESLHYTRLYITPLPRYPQTNLTNSSLSSLEVWGLEPQTFSVQARRSPS